MLNVAELQLLLGTAIYVHSIFTSFHTYLQLKKRDKFLEEETKNYLEMNDEIRKKHKDKKSGRTWSYEPPPAASTSADKSMC